MRDEYDLIVVGGGPAGYVAALRAAQLGASVVLAERDVLGGTCLNRGCIPTKSYLQTAEAIQSAREWASRGLILDSPPRLDMKKALACKNQAVRRLTAGVKALLESRKVDIVRGNAVLVGSGRVEVEGSVGSAALRRAHPSLPPSPLPRTLPPQRDGPQLGHLLRPRRLRGPRRFPACWP